uniref:EGF-like domain-containing protein n=1 Tax=Magallana gigas TaxID=29159 RepID=A0A8W8L810_MAGGI
MRSFHWITLLLNFNFQHCSAKDDCSSIVKRAGTSPGCCPADFHFRGGICIPCLVGYYGPNCSHKCPYPSYGHRCVLNCNCTEEMCDIKVGCEGRTSRSPTYNPKKLVEKSVGENKTATNISHVLDSAKKTVQFNYASVLLITVAGTYFLVLLLVAIGFQLRSRVVCIKVENDNGKEYSEIGNI